MFLRLFNNDWYPVWTDIGEWMRDGVFSRYVTYEIVYSPSKKKYKLITEGYEPKKHSLYIEAVKKLNEFINKGAVSSTTAVQGGKVPS